MRYWSKFQRLALLLSIAFCLSTQAIDITFTDVASEVGLTYVGQSFGQSWGDYDNDGYADIYVSNHGFATTILKNMNGLSFSDQSALITADLAGDIHGGAWADFDNDGDRDLLFIEGASGGVAFAPNRLLVNTGGIFVDQASLWGLEYSPARARMASWFDWNQDGLLDVGFANWPRNDGQAPTAIFTRTLSEFQYDNDNLGFAANSSNNFMSLVQVNGYPEPALLVHVVFGFPEGFYDMTNVPFVPLEQVVGLPPASAVWDIMTEDFDGNLDEELFLIRQVEANEVVLFSDTELRGRVYGSGVGELGFTFATQGPIDIQVSSVFVALTAINIGPNGVAPDFHDFTLDPTDPETMGESVHNEATSQLYIHYDPDAELWNVAVTNRLSPNIQIFSQTIISDIETQNFTSSDGARTAVKFNQSPQGYGSFPVAFGLTEPYPCRSGAAADFDNDMDIDVYMGCVSGAINRPNRLLENDGAGSFTEVAGAAGAAGTVLGRTDVVTVADFNNDGFMDILVTNGMGTRPFAVGPTELFRNSGNANSWIHINLVGINANRDGIGASVEVEAGGVTQRRLQDNGSKRFGQDDQRLHFGLGSNATVDSIRVRWPGGQEQQLGPVTANQILTIVQAVDSDGDGLFDDQDNCRDLANPAQLDPDADGFGNRCDPDFNNDFIVNFQDLQLFGGRFLSADVEADLNGDGSVNFIDLAIFSDFFLLPPGPGAFGQN